MAFNGSGLFQRLYSWVSDAANSIPITASRMDGEDNGFAAGLSNCITKDGQQTVTANIPFNNFKVTGLGTPTLSTDASTKGYVDGLTMPYYVDSGTANTITINSGISGYTAGMVRQVKINATNTNTTVTLNDNSVGAIGVKQLDGTNPAVGQLVAGYIVTFIHNGTNWIATNVTLSIIPIGLTVDGAFGAAGVAALQDGTSTIADGLSNAFTIGYRDTPQNVQTGSYGVVLADRGKQIAHNSVSAHTFTIPANATIAMPVGSVCRLVNLNGSGALTIAITSDTLRWLTTAGTGSRTLTAPGAATIEKVSSTEWWISGINVS